jgi:hypothetical protein
MLKDQVAVMTSAGQGIGAVSPNVLAAASAVGRGACDVP